jgi:hypothetical protein
MMEKSAQTGEDGGACPPPFSISTLMYKVVLCTLQLRGQIHSSYFYSTPVCTLWVYPENRDLEERIEGLAIVMIEV